MEALSVYLFLENITVMDVIINVSPVKCSYVSAPRVALHCSITCSPSPSVPLPPPPFPPSPSLYLPPYPPADKLVIPHQFCAGIWRPAHEDLADIPHLLQC